MNNKSIIFSGIVSSLIGGGLGLVMAHLFPTPYTASLYQNMDRKYAAVGIVGGLLIGTSQEYLRQLKLQQDQKERDRGSNL